MIRILIGAITVILVGAAFIFLWLSNPLYAFVGGVVFLVFLVVGFVFLLNFLNQSTSTSTKKLEAAPVVESPRTGVQRHPEQVEKPEDSWDDNDSRSGGSLERKDATQQMIPIDGVKKSDSSAPEQQSQAPAKPTPEEAVNFGVISPPAPSPPPIINVIDEDEWDASEAETSHPEPETEKAVQEKGDNSDHPDFANMSPEEINAWMASRSQQADTSEEARTEPEPEVEAKKIEKERRRTVDNEADNKPLISEIFDFLENTDEEDEEEIDDTDGAIFEEETSIDLDDNETDFEDVADEIKQKIDSGTFGDSAEDVEEFFQKAFEEAATRTDTPDDIDDEDDFEIPDEIEEGEDGYVGREIPTWLEGELDKVDAELADWLRGMDGDDKDAPSSTSDLDLKDGDEGYGADIDLPAEMEEEPVAEMPDWLRESMLEEQAKSDDELIPDAEWADDASIDDTIIPEPSSNFDLMDMVEELPEKKQQEFFALMTEIPINDQTETQLIRLYEKLSQEGDSTSGGESEPVGKLASKAQFTAYYPRQASAKTTYGFYVYAHQPNSLIADDIQQFQKQLGGRVPKPKAAEQTVMLNEGATLAVMIDCDALNFNQIGAMQQWQSPYVRFDFEFSADESLIDEIVEGRIAILLGMIEIASIDFQLSIAPVNPLSMVTAIPHDPLSADNFQSSATASLYQKIFVSYSRKDSDIAEHYRKAQLMAGNIIFMDTHSIRAGEDWESTLKQFIDDADVFQLFWSEHSAVSDHVRFEWDYALTHRCPDTRCLQFIRPTYWEKPLPDIPKELNHLNFAFVEIIF